MERAGVLDRFVTGLPVRMEPATGNPRLQAVVIDADERTGLALGSSASTGPSRIWPRRGAQETMPSLFDLPFDDTDGTRPGEAAERRRPGSTRSRS